MPKKAAADNPHITPQLRPLAVPVASIRPDPANAREHDDGSLDAIQASLRVFGQRKPIVVNRRTNRCEAGSGTLMAARALGWPTVAAVFVDDDPATATGFALADNRVAELSSWNADALAKALDRVKAGMDESLDKVYADLAELAPPPTLLTDGLDAATPAPPPAPAAPTAHVRMVQLFFDEATAAEFLAAVERLKKAFRVDNVTDAVLEAVRRADV